MECTLSLSLCDRHLYFLALSSLSFAPYLAFLRSSFSLDYIFSDWKVSELQRELSHLGEQRRLDREGRTAASKKVKAFERDLARATNGGSGSDLAPTSPSSPISPLRSSSSYLSYSAPMSPLSPGSSSSSSGGNKSNNNGNSSDNRSADELRRALKVR